MTERVSQVDATAALNHKLFNRRILQSRMKERIEESREITEIANRESADSAYFQSEQDYFISGQQDTENYVHYSVLNEQIKNATQQASKMNEIIKNAGAQYLLSSEDIDAVIDSFGDGKTKKDQFKSLAEKIADAPEGSEEDLLDSAVKSVCSSKAEIYLLLLYVLEYIKSRESKKKLLERFEQIKEEFEKQENGYLFEFFSIQKMTENITQSNVNTAKFINQMAEVSSGSVSLENLKQTLDFVRGLFGDDFHKMVSLFMKIRTLQLQKINKQFLAQEEKSELSNLLRQENLIIILNTLYNQSKKSVEKLKKVEPLQEKYGEFISQLITTIDSMFISPDSIAMIGKTLGIKPENKQLLNTLLSELLRIYIAAPLVIFNNQANRIKLLDTLRSITTKILPVQKEGETLSFLKKKKKLIKFV